MFLFLEMRMTKKILTQVAAIFFLNEFNWII